MSEKTINQTKVNINPLTHKPIKVDYPNMAIEDVITPDFKQELDKITFDKTTSSNTSRTIRNIRKNITAKIKSEFNITDKNELREKVDAILKIQGLHEDNFDFMSNFDNGLQQKINDISIDDNANKSEKSVNAFIFDLTKPVHKLIGHDTLYRVMKDLYGRTEAKRLSASMYDYSLGISDSTGINSIYCWALDTTKLVTIGRNFGSLHSKPSKRVSSYISAVCETVHQISNHIVGAAALATFFLDIAHLMIYKQRITLSDLRNNIKGVRKNLENEFQQFIYSVNHNSRDGASQTPFTNVSLFDKVKLATLIGDENYSWYFPNKKAVASDLDLDDKMSDEDFRNYVIDYITECQNVFLDLFDKGDPLSNGAPYTFPVCFPGEELFTLNNKITSFEEAFKDLPMGWSNISKQNLTTIYNGKNIKINKVFKSISSDFVKINGTNGRPLIVTPEHKLKLYSGELICAKDLRLKDKLLVDQTVIEDNDSTLTEIDVADFIEDPALIGYKIKTTPHVKSIFRIRDAYNESAVDGCNHKRVILKTFRDLLFDDDFYIIPSHEKERVKTHFAQMKHTLPRYLKLDYDFGRFLGLYYAEGHNSRRGEMGISLNKNEVTTISFVQNFLKKLGIKSKVRKFDHTIGIQVCFNSITFSELLLKLVGKHAGKKSFGDLPLRAGKQFRLGILHGVIEGDGFCNAYSANLSSISKRGIYSIMLIANSLGIKTTLSTDLNQRGYGKQNAQISYILKFSKRDILKLKYNTSEKLSKLTYPQIDVYKHGFIINSIEELNFENPKIVYNIEVDTPNHLFTLPGGIVSSNCTLNTSKDDNGNALDQSFLKSICKRDIAKYNIFCSSGTKIASCCRMINSKEMMDSFASQVNSLGGGGSASIGSHRVVTINFQRIALECSSMEDYYKILDRRIEDAAKILKAHKLLILKIKDAGLQPFITNGYINVNRLFSTFGILGTAEANKTLRERFDIPQDEDLVKEILVHFNQKTLEEGAKLKLTVNQEQIPAESMATRFAGADKILFNLPDTYYKLYANQHIPLWEDKTVFERVKLAGSYDKLLTGGSIVHLNVDGDTTPQQNMKLIEYAIKCDCEHFAINKCYTICNDCGYTTNHKTDTCEKCSSKNVDHKTRIIGYFSKVSNWGKVRREWEFPRRVFKSSTQLLEEKSK